MRPRRFKLCQYQASEHSEQSSLFRWAKLARYQYPALELMFAIPNGGHRNIQTAVMLKREGVRAGVPDICLPVSAGGYHGLFIELKRVTGKPTGIQEKWITALNKQSYLAVVCYGWEQARKVIEAYLSGRWFDEQKIA